MSKCFLLYASVRSTSLLLATWTRQIIYRPGRSVVPEASATDVVMPRSFCFVVPARSCQKFLCQKVIRRLSISAVEDTYTITGQKVRTTRIFCKNFGGIFSPGRFFLGLHASARKFRQKNDFFEKSTRYYVHDVHVLFRREQKHVTFRNIMELDGC